MKMGRAKSEISQILNSEENSNRKVPNQMPKSNDKTHQTNEHQPSHSRLSTYILKCRKCWIEPGPTAPNLLSVRQSH